MENLRGSQINNYHNIARNGRGVVAVVVVTRGLDAVANGDIPLAAAAAAAVAGSDGDDDPPLARPKLKRSWEPMEKRLPRWLSRMMMMMMRLLQLRSHSDDAEDDAEDDAANEIGRRADAGESRGRWKAGAEGHLQASGI